MRTLLDRIDAYCDAVPRAHTRAEDVGSLVVFVREGNGWPYYARPRRGGPEPVAADVDRARARQRELGLPEAFEWIADVSPAMRAAGEAGGLAIGDHPLMAIPPDVSSPARADVDVRLVTRSDDLRTIGEVAAVAFAHPGTAVGEADEREVAARAARRTEADDAHLRERLGSGSLLFAAAFVDGRPVATGVHQPVGGVSEIAAVGTLPTARRQGFGAAVTAFLVEDARVRGVDTVCLSAGSEEIARVYASLGFERVGTACVAEPAEGGL